MILAGESSALKITAGRGRDLGKRVSFPIIKENQNVSESSIYKANVLPL